MEIATVSTIALVGGLNDLIGGMGDLEEAIKDGDTFDGFNESIEEANRRATGFFQKLRDNIPLLERVAQLRNGIVGGGTAPTPQNTFGGPGGLGGIGLDIARRAEEEAKEAAQAQTAAGRAKRNRAKAFDELIKGLGLKLDRKRLTEGVADDLEVLREIERAIQRRILQEGRTFKLVDQLTQVQLQIASAIGEAEANAQERETDALEKRLERQEKADERRRNRIKARQERRQREQFGELGLTGTGDKRTPSTGALKRRLGNVRDSVEGTILDTKQTERQLDRIQAVLAGKFGKVGQAVRDAILGMLNDITGALDGEGSKKGPLTKTSGLNTKKLLEGLGLDEEEIRALRGRLSGFNSAGLEIAAGQANRATGGGAGGRGFGNIVVESHTTINLDGKQIAKVTTKEQQKARRRNPKQKRGPNRNI
jgi:hypothetical protein